MVKSELHNNKIQSSSRELAMAAAKASSCKKKKYKGVRMRSWGSWVSEIRAPNQKTRIWLGSYSTPEAAARAYDAALLCLKGSSSAPNLNFPSQYYNIPDDTVLSPKSIQRVAAAAANSFVDHTNTSTPPPSSHLPSSTSPSSSSSSSSFASSPSMVSSPSDQLDDDVSLIQSFIGPYNNNNNESSTINIPPISMNSSISSWYNFDDLQSPKLYLDDHQVLDGAVSFNSPVPMIDDFYEGDIRLWSFAE